MAFENPNLIDNFELLSVPERTTRLSTLLENPLSVQEIQNNLSLLCWGARQCQAATSGERGGSQNMLLAPQELLAQDAPETRFRKQQIYDAIYLIRDPKLVKDFKEIGTVKTCDLPDGVYRNLNVFKSDQGESNRTAFFNEEQKRIWQQKNIVAPDEGLAFHPVLDKNEILTAIKVFWQGHRNTLTVRTITLDEMKSNLKDGTQINLSNYALVKK